MALLFMESFDGYGGTVAHMTRWFQAPTLVTSSPTPRTGTHAARGTMLRTIAPTGSLINAFAFYWNGASAATSTIYDVAGSTSPANAQCCLGLEADGKIRVRNGTSGGTVLEATASVVLVSTSWNFIEAKILVGNTGTWTVKCNGVQVLNGSGDTQARATSAMAGLDWQLNVAGIALDDLCVLDTSGSYNNDFIGDCKVECLTAQAGNGSNVGLTCSTGTDHGALVDESPANDDTDYNYSATPGVKDTYNFTNLATVGTIKAVQVSARARKTDSATKELALVARVSGADYDGATQAVAATTYGQYVQIWERRPSDSAAWVIADVDGGEFGLKVVT